MENTARNGGSASMLASTDARVLEMESLPIQPQARDTGRRVEGAPLSVRLTPTMRLLQILAHYAFPLEAPPLSTVCFDVKWRSKSTQCLLLFTIAVIGVNGALFAFTARTTALYQEIFPLLHATTISSIIAGIKPLVNLVTMFIFLVTLRRHRRLLKKLDTVDKEFHESFGLRPNVNHLNIAVWISCLLIFLFVFVVRMADFILMGEQLGRYWLTDVSLLLVPMLSVWNTIPLLYYVVINRIIQFWCQELSSQIRGNGALQQRRCLKFYYQQFLKITSVQEAVGHLFNPFVLFSLAWSVFTLCLAIYFATQSDSSMDAPLDMEPSPEDALNWLRLIYLNIVWSILQICVAMGHIVLICATGTKTNETNRTVLRAVLAVDLERETDSDRFQLTRFIYKFQTQYMWGMSVWRAFPLERSAFFTIVSLISTYAFLLLKLKGSESPHVKLSIFDLITANSSSHLNHS